MPLLPSEKEALSSLKARLEEKHCLLDFRIYGSKARGTDVPESDVDVMIVLDESSPTIESEIDDIIFEINLQYDCLIVAVYYSREELEDGPFDESPLYKAIQREGVRL